LAASDGAILRFFFCLTWSTSGSSEVSLSEESSRDLLLW
jgi:hypothetical protein